MQSSNTFKPKIAVTYSASVGGASVVSLQETMKDLDSEVVDADYRKIMPPQEDLDDIYKNPQKMKEVFDQAKANATTFLQDVDCLMLSGNAKMVDPLLYGKERAGQAIDLARSIAEMALVHVAMQRGMPILGICGGHQIINTYLGGEVQKLENSQLEKQGFMDYGDVEFSSNSELAKIIDPKRMPTDEMVIDRFFGAHKEVVVQAGGRGMISAGREGALEQSIEDGELDDEKGSAIGGGKDYFKVVATDKNTGDIEAVESQYGSPVIGLQFHPEVGVKGLPVSSFTYTASSEEKAIKNHRIFEAFRESAVAFHNKRDVGAAIKKFTGMADDREVSVKERVAAAEGGIQVGKQQVDAKSPQMSKQQVDPNSPQVLHNMKEKKGPNRSFLENLPLIKDIAVMMRKRAGKVAMLAGGSSQETIQAKSLKEKYMWDAVLRGDETITRKHENDIADQVLAQVVAKTYDSVVDSKEERKEKFVSQVIDFIEANVSMDEKTKKNLTDACNKAFDKMDKSTPQEKQGIIAKLVDIIKELLGFKKTVQLAQKLVKEVTQEIKKGLKDVVSDRGASR